VIAEIIKNLRKGEGNDVEFKPIYSSELLKDIVAFANTRGGTLYLGVDHNGNIRGIKEEDLARVWAGISSIEPLPPVSHEIIEIDRKKIGVFKVKPSKKLHTLNGAAYIRIGATNKIISPQELLEKASESLVVYWDEMVSEYKVGEEDRDSLELFKKRAQEFRGQVPSLEKYTKEGKWLNGAALLLISDFSENKYGILHYVDGDIFRYNSTLSHLEKLYKSIMDHMPEVRRKRKGLGYQMVPMFPAWAVREALVNAVAHRNYFDLGPIYVKQSKNRLEIISPGAFPPGVTPEMPRHKPRNPLLCEMLRASGYIERFGEGIKKIKEIINEYAQDVDFWIYVNEDYTKVVFEARLEISVEEQRILELLEKGPMSSSALAKELGLSKKTMVERLNNMVARGLIVKEGRGPATRYKIA